MLEIFCWLSTLPTNNPAFVKNLKHVTFLWSCNGLSSGTVGRISYYVRGVDIARLWWRMVEYFEFLGAIIPIVNMWLPNFNKNLLDFTCVISIEISSGFGIIAQQRKQAGNCSIGAGIKCIIGARRAWNLGQNQEMCSRLGSPCLQMHWMVPECFLCRCWRSGLRSPAESNNLSTFNLTLGSSLGSGLRASPPSHWDCSISASAQSSVNHCSVACLLIPELVPAKCWGRSRHKSFHTFRRKASLNWCWNFCGCNWLFKNASMVSPKTGCWRSCLARAMGPSTVSVHWWTRERNRLTSCGVVYVLRKGLRALRCSANSGSKLGLVRSAKMACGDAL